MTRERATIIFHALLDNGYSATLAGTARQRALDVRSRDRAEHLSIQIEALSLTLGELRKLIDLIEHLGCDMRISRGSLLITEDADAH